MAPKTIQEELRRVKLAQELIKEVVENPSDQATILLILENISCRIRDIINAQTMHQFWYHHPDRYIGLRGKKGELLAPKEPLDET